MCVCVGVGGGVGGGVIMPLMYVRTYTIFFHVFDSIFVLWCFV